MNEIILILEDNQSRLDVFSEVLASVSNPKLSAVTWNNAHAMINELGQYLREACVISLDHDLYPTDAAAGDPGDGLDVAQHLATLEPFCHVIIHSSNADRSKMMQGELELAGWNCIMIGPFGDGWVEKDWLPVILSAAAAKR